MHQGQSRIIYCDTSPRHILYVGNLDYITQVSQAAGVGAVKIIILLGKIRGGDAVGNYFIVYVQLAI